MKRLIVIPIVAAVFSVSAGTASEADKKKAKPGIEAIAAGEHRKTFKYFKKAAREECRLCQHNLGMMYYAGIGTERDMIQALVWLRVSALNGDMRSLSVAEKIALALDRKKREEVVARSRELDLADMSVTPDIQDSRAGSRELRMRFANVRELTNNPYRQRMLENPDHYLRFETEENRTTWGNGAAHTAMEYKSERARRKAEVERIRSMLPRPRIRYRDFRLIEMDEQKRRSGEQPRQQDQHPMERSDGNDPMERPTGNSGGG